ncbi:hypothetical protein ACRCUN_11880 [Mycobacterium sp. LTG2003]
MTTHERPMPTAQPDQTSIAEPQQMPNIDPQQTSPVEPQQTSTAQPEHMSATAQPGHAAEEGDVRDAGTTGTQQADVETPDDNTLLFADEHRSGLRSRWDEVQAAFVDDPKQCVQKADNLVADVVEQLTASFADTRSRLEAQWARGEDASTEDLRLALKRYRDFFQRLLSV